jgi:hypothetical protein
MLASSASIAAMPASTRAESDASSGTASSCPPRDAHEPEWVGAVRQSLCDHVRRSLPVEADDYWLSSKAARLIDDEPEALLKQIEALRLEGSRDEALKLSCQAPSTAAS